MEGQHKQPLRKILRSALASKRGADEILDAILELQNTLNALLIKLDADAGVTDVDFESTLKVEPIE